MTDDRQAQHEQDGEDGARLARREAAIRRLGTRHPRCPCGETEPLALTGRHPQIRCYECQALAAGRSWIEQQHPQGRHNGPVTVPIPGNDHRVIDDRKNDWPRQTLRNPDGSPLLRAAACLRGWLDTLRHIIEETIGWIPAFLEALDRWLCQLIGPRWWDGLPAAG
jgi:hypothetical protein